MSKSPSFGKRLCELRQKAKMSQEELAERSGIHRQTIAKLETGQRDNPTWETVQALARALGVSVGTFDLNEDKR